MNCSEKLKPSTAHSSDQESVPMEPILQRKLRALDQNKSTKELRYGISSILGKSESLNEVLRQANAAAQCNVHVLLQGDSGTGKELFAQSMHQLSQTHGPFIAINCGAIPRSLVESELFGYEAGTFTGADRRGKPGKLELADGGTLFLDEIGDMPLSMQPVLLRVLEEKMVVRLGSAREIPVSFRVIAATNQDLISLIDKKKFRKDLYYRLSGFKINLPSLKERGDDVLLLARHFIGRSCAAMDKEPIGISPEVEKLIISYNWPGNIRQLENVMAYAVSMSTGKIIQVEDLPDEITGYDESQVFKGNVISLRQNEKILIERALYLTNNNIIKAAELLEVSKSTLYRKIHEYRFSDNN